VLRKLLRMIDPLEIRSISWVRAIVVVIVIVIVIIIIITKVNRIRIINKTSTVASIRYSWGVWSAKESKWPAVRQRRRRR